MDPAPRRRALSYRQALRCETARLPRCECRCGGKLHGAQRGRPEELAPEDPHHAEEPMEKKRRPRPCPWCGEKVFLDERKILPHLTPRTRTMCRGGGRAFPRGQKRIPGQDRLL